MRHPSVWVIRAIFAIPILLEIGMLVMINLPQIPDDWAGPALLAWFAAVPLTFVLLSMGIARTPFRAYSRAAAVLVPASLIFNVVFFWVSCTSNFQMAPNGNPN